MKAKANIHKILDQDRNYVRVSSLMHTIKGCADNLGERGEADAAFFFYQLYDFIQKDYVEHGRPMEYSNRVLGF